jgi:predicted amidohydrolase
LVEIHYGRADKMSEEIIKVASAQYPVEFHENWQSFAGRIRNWVGEAASAGARVLVFPEYLGFEAASIFRSDGVTRLADQLIELQGLKGDFVNLFSECAVQHGVNICAGTFPVGIESGGYHNRAYFLTPDGAVQYQDKLLMTPFERKHTDIRPGFQVNTLESSVGKVAINVCYDSEFPLFARRQAESSAVMVLVPSCTDTLAGYYRVRIGCQARALENQMYVVQSVLIGQCSWSDLIDENTGAAGIYGPVDAGFPANGCIAEGSIDQPGWVYGNLEIQGSERVRHGGHTTNFQDWARQFQFV